MEFISIGPYCDSADILKEFGLRKKAYPFDYVFSSLEMISHAINDGFNIFLDKQYYTHSKNVTQHSYYSTFIDTEILRRHHIAHGLPKIAKDLKNREFFLHHNLFNNDVYSSFIRRCNRLLSLIDNNNKIVFIYYNRYTDVFDDLLEFYSHFANHTNICVVGIFENLFEKKMLFNGSKCKIYQNYDKQYIFDEIQSTF
jgi:hypothetical protein